MSEIRSQATPARDELAERLMELWGWLGPDAAKMLVEQVEAAGWLKPRTVNSAADLDALPVESVALFGITPGYKRHDGLWETSGVNDRFTTNEVFESLGGQPATVLFTPGDAG